MPLPPPEAGVMYESRNKDIVLYFLSIVSLSFWCVIWIMHFCALTNAKLKLNKRSYLSAASKRKKKLKLLREKILPCCWVIDNSGGYSNIVHVKNIEAETNLKEENQLYNQLNKSLLSLSAADDKAKINLDFERLKLVETNGEQKLNFSPESVKTLTTSDNNIDSIDQLKQTEQMKEPMADILGQQQVKQLHQYSYFKTKINNDFFYINFPLPGVSIIKPLVGIDTNLHRNLETFFNMDYPTYEILFCVQDPDDAATLVVKNLLKMYPHIDARLFTGGARVGVNPKINNMQPAYEAMKYELVLISDSGISMKRDTLLDMVSHMREDIALVHQMPFVCDGREGFQSIVEKVYFGTAHARVYLTADLLSINCSTGMSALMRKHLLDEVGGIKAFGQYLAEDFFFAKSFTDRGWKISISSQPAWQNSANSGDSLITLNCRLERWVKLRFAMIPFLTMIEPFTECMLLGFLGALSISYLWAFDPYAVFLFHVISWFLFDYKLLCIVQNGPLDFSTTEFVIAWLIRECTALLVFLKALSNPKVTWRSRIFKLKWGGHAEEITPQLGQRKSSYIMLPAAHPIES